MPWIKQVLDIVAETEDKYGDRVEIRVAGEPYFLAYMLYDLVRKWWLFAISLVIVFVILWKENKGWRGAVFPLLLYRGWNLVSLPLFTVIDLGQLGDRLVGVTPGSISIFYYNPITGKWMQYIGRPISLSNLTDGKAYWIYSPSNAILLVDGSVNAPYGRTLPRVYALHRGWNMLGYIVDGNVTIMRLLNASDTGAFIRDTYVIRKMAHYIFAWDPIQQNWMIYDRYAISATEGRWIIADDATFQLIDMLDDYTGNNRDVIWPGMGLFVYMYEEESVQPGGRTA